jgi:hypothetical protein
MRYMGDIAPAKDTRLLFARRLAAQHTFVIREHNKSTPLGDIGLQISHLYPHEADLGYAILGSGERDCQRSRDGVCQYAFERWRHGDKCLRTRGE